MNTVSRLGSVIVLVGNRIRLRHQLCGVALVTVALLSSACSSMPEPQPTSATTDVTVEHGVPGGTVVNTIVLNAKVISIDKAARKVVLEDAEGDQFPVTVGPDAVNFNQVRVGDHLIVTATEEVLVYLADEGAAPMDGSGSIVSLAPKGSKPAAVMAGTRQITGTVTAIDAKKRTATLKFANGDSRTFSVRDDIDLTQRKVGETVVFSVTEMVALTVKKP